MAPAPTAIARPLPPQAVPMEPYTGRVPPAMGHRRLHLPLLSRCPPRGLIISGHITLTADGELKAAQQLRLIHSPATLRYTMAARNVAEAERSQLQVVAADQVTSFTGRIPQAQGHPQQHLLHLNPFLHPELIISEHMLPPVDGARRDMLR